MVGWDVALADCAVAGGAGVVGFWVAAANCEITKSAMSLISACFISIRAGLNVSSLMPATTAPLPLLRRHRILSDEANAPFYPALASQATKNRDLKDCDGCQR
jgi:hypothetical protein